MQLSDINPFLRFAELQPSVMSSAPFHCAFDYRIFYILDGTATFVLPDRTIDLSSGMLLYIRPGTPYYFEGKVKVIVLNFDMTREKSDEKTPKRPAKEDRFDHELIFENDPPTELDRFIVIKDTFELENKLQECITYYRFPTPYSDATTSGIIKEILCYIAQHSLSPKNKSPEIVQKIMLYIQQHYDDRQLSNSEISRIFNYHSFYLNRLFKEHTGTTLHQAVILERIRIAKRLLRRTTLSIDDIADECGFADRAQFCTTFRKTEGITPTEYRKDHSKG